MNVIYPVNVCIKRFYRAYVLADENATDEEIRNKLTERIMEEEKEEDVLFPDPDIGIESHDIVFMEIDHEGFWTEQEHEDFKKILMEMEFTFHQK